MVESDIDHGATISSGNRVVANLVGAGQANVEDDLAASQPQLLLSRF